MGQIEEETRGVLPCPFCGGQAVVRALYPRENLWHVGCLNHRCHGYIYRYFTRGNAYESREEALKAWNKRK